MGLKSLTLFRFNLPFAECLELIPGIGSWNWFLELVPSQNLVKKSCWNGCLVGYSLPYRSTMTISIPQSNYS